MMLESLTRSQLRLNCKTYIFSILKAIVGAFLIAALVFLSACSGNSSESSDSSGSTHSTDSMEIVTSSSGGSTTESTIDVKDAPETTDSPDDTEPIVSPAMETIKSVRLAVPDKDEGEDSLEKSATPSVTATVYPGKTLVCLAGSCGEQSVIIIRGGTEDVAFNSDKGYFMGTVEINDTGETTLHLTAKANGKAESDAVKVTVKPSGLQQIRKDNFEVIVGYDSQCHFVSALPEYTGSNLLSDNQVKSLTDRIKKRVDFLNEKMPETELIYLIIPDSMTVFPETVPEQYKRSTKDITRSGQFAKAAGDAGATVIVATDAIISAKGGDLKLFHKTDSHWTEYGAWIAYTELMNHISTAFPEAAPRTFEEMNFYEKLMKGGDMPYYLGINSGASMEQAVRAAPDLETISYTLKFKAEDDLLMNHDTTPKARTIKTDRPSLPSAYIMRDSYGIALYDMLAERFDMTIYEKMWTYTFNNNAIEKMDVDYIIYIVAERNIGDILY